MINKLLLIIIAILTISCSQKQDSMFFENYKYDEINLSKSIQAEDSLNHFSISIPDSTWKPVRFLSEDENGLTVGDTTKGFLRLINIHYR